MYVNTEELQGSCPCGKSHRLSVREIEIASGALNGFDEIVNKAGINGIGTAVYDSNTYDALGEQRSKAQKEIVLNSQKLHANEHGVEALLSQMSSMDYLIAVGSGTIHDIVRYCAAQKGLPFVSVPTAASVDGFVSTVAAMTLGGLKVTVSGVAPTAVIADLDIIAKAPMRLMLSGVGDMIGKYISLADWKISSILTGEYYCNRVAELEYKALSKVLSSFELLKKQDMDAAGELTYGLILSGLAMQMIGNSRPASGAEHHLSHLWEMAVINEEPEALHGEKVGVGTLEALKKYHSYESLSDISSRINLYGGLTEEYAKENFGQRYKEILRENQKDCLLEVGKEQLFQKWGEIKEILLKLPKYEEIYAKLERLGAKRTMEDIGLAGSLLPKSIELSPYVRNRLTFMRLIKLFM